MSGRGLNRIENHVNLIRQSITKLLKINQHKKKINLYDKISIWYKLKAFADNKLTLSLLMTTQEAFVDNVYQDQTAQNMQSLIYTVNTFILDKLQNFSSSCNGSLFSANEKLHSFSSERVK